MKITFAHKLEGFRMVQFGLGDRPVAQLCLSLRHLDFGLPPSVAFGDAEAHCRKWPDQRSVVVLVPSSAEDGGGIRGRFAGTQGKT